MSSPLVLDTRDLGRRAGSMKHIETTVPAPGDIGLELVAVPPGSDLDLDLRLEAVSEGVLVTGTVVVSVVGECARCLEPIAFDTEVDIQELYEYPSQDARGRLTGEKVDPDQSFLDGDNIDLEPVIRDAVVLALPLAPVCQPDCQGLCSECGANLNDDPEHHHDAIDERWSALGELKLDNPDAKSAN